MTLTIDLPEDLERELSAEAARRGCSLEEYAVQLLSDVVSPRPAVTDGASLVAYWEKEGLIGWRPEITDPAGYARQIRKEASRRSGRMSP